MSLNQWLLKHKNPIYDKIAGLIYGCAIADCLGVQAEGRTVDDIKQYIPGGKVTYMPTADMRGIVHGDWTDDTDQLILLMDTLSENDLVFNEKVFAEKIYNWCKHGFPELGDLAGMGLGQLTAKVISKDYFKRTPVRAALDTYVELGCDLAPNGAIMRCGISAISSNWRHTAIRQSLITHTDCRCVYSSWACTLICHSLLYDKIPDYKTILDSSVDFITKKKQSAFDEYKAIYSGELSDMLVNLKLDSNGIGYTLKTLGVAFYTLRSISKCLSATSYEDIVLSIINKGGDTDTNAAVAGQILGSYLGFSKLPKKWLDKLLHKNWLDKKIIKLFSVIEKKISS